MSEPAKNIKNIILQDMPDAAVTAQNMRTDGRDFFKVRVITARFEGMSLVQQHRQVYNSLKKAGMTDFENLSIYTAITEKK